MRSPFRATISAVSMLACLGAWSHGAAHAADRGAIDAAVARGARYLQSQFDKSQGGRRTLAAYAIYKAGSHGESREVSAAVADALAKVVDDKYSPGANNEAQYQAGIEAMLLAEIDPVRYRKQIAAIANFLLDTRLDVNVWDYKGPTSPGDTSVTQYSCLGLWAAARAGIEVPDEVWDKIMLWHFKSHRPDGGFAYVPGTAQGPGGGASTLNMTAGAIGSMSIAAMYLFPDQMQKNVGFSGPKRQKSQNDDGKKFGILEKEQPAIAAGDASDPVNGHAPVSRPQGPYVVQATFALYKEHTTRALEWLAKNFEVQNRVGPAMYYYYTLERMAALTNTEKLGPHDWFQVCSDFLLKQQQADGSWTLSGYDGGGPYLIGTSFAVLFMTRSTAKLLNRLPRVELVGGGLLAGGRGLPDDLKQLELKRGDVEVRKPSGPLDALLGELTKAGGEDLFKIQEKIVEKVQLGDRSELIGQTDQLAALSTHPDPQIRRTALWALGRSDDLNLVRHAIRALQDDPDVDVLVEAHNALCWFARRPDGFGVADAPLTGLPPDATDKQKQEAVQKWREQAIQAWGTWYVRVCPYEERDDPFVLRLKQSLNNRRPRG